MSKLNENIFERRLGIFFTMLWCAITLFYLLWDGWVYEWAECGYDGPNQHFDFDLLDMKWEVVDGTVVYYATNNLHSIIYLCFFTLLIGSLGLLTGSQYFKQGAMVLLAFPVIAGMSTIMPLGNHEYIVQIIYDIVHISGITIGIYLMYNNEIDLKKASPVLWSTWPIYILSRILVQPSPYWENNTTGYFSVNQVNNMPFYLYGVEYVIVIFIFYAVYTLFSVINRKIENRKVKAIYPFAIFAILCITFILTGLITLQEIDMGTC